MVGDNTVDTWVMTLRGPTEYRVQALILVSTCCMGACPATVAVSDNQVVYN